MKRDEMYYAREDLAWNAWLKERRTLILALVEGCPPDAIHEVARSAFISGARFASKEAEIQAVVVDRGK